MLHAKFKLTTKNRIKRETFKKKNIQKYISIFVEEKKNTKKKERKKRNILLHYRHTIFH